MACNNMLEVNLFYIEKLNNPYLFPFFNKLIINTGNKTKLVSVPTNRVNDVSQPKANVPPNLLKQKIINPEIKTNDV